MIISRTPFRISFTGGGSDLREYYRKEGGAVLSTSIDKYVYLSMHPLFNDRGYHLKYFKNEICRDLEHVKHPIIKEVFTRYDIRGVDFSSSSDVPSGTGLGSSSSFTNGLINLCSAYNKKLISSEKIAKEACEVEIDVLKSPIGKQDQYASAIGGLNFIRFNSDESVTVEKITLSEGKKEKLQNSLMLFYLGSTRSASEVLQKIDMSQKTATLRKMVTLTEILRDELNNDSIDSFGDVLRQAWEYKKELSSDISNATIDHWYKVALENGAEGGKVLGAGSGGFLLLYVPKGQEFVRDALRLYELPFNKTKGCQDK